MASRRPRVLEEESGYTLAELEVLQPKVRIHTLAHVALHPQPLVLNTHAITTDHFHSDVVYAFVANSEPSGKVHKNESTDIRWLTQTKLNALDEPEIYRNTQEIYNFIFDVCLKDWEQVSTLDYAL